MMEYQEYQCLPVFGEPQLIFFENIKFLTYSRSFICLFVIFREFSGSQTGSENGWWKVTLSFNRYISYVDIYNRLDCCQDRLKNARVLVDGDLVAIIPQVDGIQGYTIPVFRRGRYMIICLISYRICTSGLSEEIYRITGLQGAFLPID